MAGWHPWLDGRESEWTPGVGDGHGDLAWCDSWGCKESDTTEQLIWRVWEKNKMSCRGQQWASCLHALDSRWERKKNFFLRFSNPKLSCAIEFAQIPLMCTFTLKRDEWVLSVVPHTEQTQIFYRGTTNCKINFKNFHRWSSKEQKLRRKKLTKHVRKQ